METGIKILFAGDIFISHDSPELLSEELKKILEEHDLRSCNFEAPVAAEGLKPIPKAGSYLQQNPSAFRLIKDAKFNIINMANNHIYDYGDSGLRNSLAGFSDCVITGAGESFHDAYKLKILNEKNTNIGFLSFCESEFGALTSDKLSRGGYAWVNHPSVDILVMESKKTVDVLIVQVHAGIEEIEIPLPEWRERYKQLILAGADIVIGHHPHVPQGWEKFHDKFIFYSLGNFYFDMESDHKNWNKSFIVSVTVNGKSITDVKTIPIIKRKVVEINPDSSYNQYLETLCHALEDNVYYSKADAIALELWKTRYKKYYLSALNGLSAEDSVLKVLKVLARKLLSKKLSRKNDLLLLHNIRIESHRWVVQRALSLLSEEESR